MCDMHVFACSFNSVLVLHPLPCAYTAYVYVDGYSSLDLIFLNNITGKIGLEAIHYVHEEPLEVFCSSSPQLHLYQLLCQQNGLKSVIRICQ